MEGLSNETIRPFVIRKWYIRTIELHVHEFSFVNKRTMQIHSVSR